MSKSNELGKKGEQMACDFLTAKGHQIIGRNFRFEHREIDVISLINDLLVFSEIKTRSTLRYGFPEEAVTPAKQELIKSAAAYFLETHPEFTKCRFDVISIVTNGGKLRQIRHFKDVFF